MGADIHIYVEIKKEGLWEHFDGDQFTLDNYDKEQQKKIKGNTPFDWRWYQMFSFLAGVRGGLKPIKEAIYFIPKDCSEYVQSEWERWEGDGHSLSSLTARELCEFDYNQHPILGTTSRKVIFEKLVTQAQDEDDYPNDDDNEVFDYYNALGGADSHFFIHVKELEELGKLVGNLDDVRIVFWFDN